LDIKEKEGRTALNYAEGIYFRGQPPRREEKAVVLYSGIDGEPLDQRI
jgi:hypothetical protein